MSKAQPALFENHWKSKVINGNRRNTRIELKSGMPQKKGNQPGPAHAYNSKILRDQEMEIARHAERAYEQFVAQWQTRPKDKVRGRLKSAGL